MPSSVRGGHGCSSSPGDRAALAPGGTYPNPQCRMSTLPSCCCCSCCPCPCSSGHRGRFATAATAAAAAVSPSSVPGSRFGTRRAGTGGAKAGLLAAGAGKAQRGQLPPPVLAAHCAHTRWRQPANATSGRTPRQHGHTSCAAGAGVAVVAVAVVAGAVGPGVGKPPSRPWTSSPHEGHTLPDTRMQPKQHAWPQRSWRLAGAPHATHTVGDGVDSADPGPDDAILACLPSLPSVLHTQRGK